MAELRLFDPALFPPVSYMAAWMAGNAAWDSNAAFKKRNWHNRFRILGPNGPQDLSAPVVRDSTRGPQTEAHLEHRNNWTNKHWRAIETAYRSAPFFEALAPELESIMTEQHELLISRQAAAMKWALAMLCEPAPDDLVVSSSATPWRDTIEQPPFIPASFREDLPPYPQVFSERHGFIPDLSIVDLLMNEGPGAPGYLLSVQEKIMWSS